MMHITLYKKAQRFLSVAVYWTIASVCFVNYLIQSRVLENSHRNNKMFFYILFMLS